MLVHGKNNIARPQARLPGGTLLSDLYNPYPGLATLTAAAVDVFQTSAFEPFADLYALTGFGNPRSDAYFLGERFVFTQLGHLDFFINGQHANDVSKFCHTFDDSTVSPGDDIAFLKTCSLCC